MCVLKCWVGSLRSQRRQKTISKIDLRWYLGKTLSGYTYIVYWAGHCSSGWSKKWDQESLNDVQVYLTSRVFPLQHLFPPLIQKVLQELIIAKKESWCLSEWTWPSISPLEIRAVPSYRTCFSSHSCDGQIKSRFRTACIAMLKLIMFLYITDFIICR